MSVEQKLEVAIQLARLGVDVIEAGFPISSPHQLEGCKLISRQVKGPTIAALARAVEKDIDCAAEALQDAAHAAHPHLHRHLPDPHGVQAAQDTRRGGGDGRQARCGMRANKVAEVEFSPEDGTRSEIPFLCRIIEKVIDAGARIINVPDTVGYAVPCEFARVHQGDHGGDAEHGQGRPLRALPQ